MEDGAAIKLRSVADGHVYEVALSHTVVTIRHRGGGITTVLDIPVERLGITRKKRVNVLWLVLFLIGLVLGLMAGLALALGVTKAIASEKAATCAAVGTVVVFLLPAVFFFFRLWWRDAVAEFAVSGEHVIRLSFWLPLRKAQHERAEALLKAIDAAQPSAAACDDQAVCTTDDGRSPVRLACQWLGYTLLFCLPAISCERAWLLVFALLPLFKAANAVFGWWRTPPLLRQAVMHEKRGSWEKSLECLERFEAEDPDRKGNCLLARLSLLRRLGRFGDAAGLIDAHLALIGPDAHRALLDEVETARRVHQRKRASATGGWFLTHG